MPTAHRPARSILAIALVATLVAAAAPAATIAVQPRADAVPRAGVAPVPGPDVRDAAARADAIVRTPDYDRGPSLRQGLLRLRPLDGGMEPALVAAEPRAAVAPRVAWISRPDTDAPAPRARSMSPSQAAGSADPSSFRGRNHVWIPALGVNRSVSFFSCSSSAYPGDRVYRWGCAGGNNVYLFGHAHSVFKPLHDAYVRGRLVKGMKVYYADANGRVGTYAVSWWKVTTPDKGAWAYAGQSRPSLTLQTCVGAKSQYRLIVRLLKVG